MKYKNYFEINFYIAIIRMKAELILPIEWLKGKLQKDGYYFRLYKGKQIVQRCPNRTQHKKTQAEAANQKRFAQTWGQRYAGKRGRG